MLPDWLNSIYLGIVEGLTEFIPVSSTAHLLIAQHFTHQRETDVFNLVIQAGAVLALVPLFWQKGVTLTKGALSGHRQSLDFLLKLFVAFAITGAVGIVIDKKGYKLTESLEPVAWALLIGGFIILGVEMYRKNQRLSDEITWILAIAFAVGQIIAVIFPGASRSGSTIMIAMILGMGRASATEFSFMLGVITMLAASAWKLLKELRTHSEHVVWMNVLIGTVVAFIVSLIVVRWLIQFVKGHTFNGFAIYRIAAGGLLLFYLSANPQAKHEEEAPVKPAQAAAH